ncbi:hypothetical protein HW132_07000 [Brasilonema sp. CT11]|nr:hypothetical protein [Brasilonema sp. CT11]
MEERNLHSWLENWIANAPIDEVRAKFKEILPYLDEVDIAYIFYSSIIEDYPAEEIDSLLQ